MENKFPREVQAFHAGTKVKEEKLYTSGARVLAICAVANNLKGALDAAYDTMDTVEFKEMHYCKDIGHREFETSPMYVIVYWDAICRLTTKRSSLLPVLTPNKC
jgi:phosphoribosylamine-glycine ligase